EPVLDQSLEHATGRTGGIRERPSPGQQLVEDDAERVEVAARVHRAAYAPEGVEVLRRHVGQRPADHRCRVGVNPQVYRQVEVQQHRLALVCQQDVGRLQVAVQDAALVGMSQTVGQTRGDPQDGLDV